MSYKRFIEAVENKGRHTFGVTVERVYNGEGVWMPYHTFLYNEFTLDDEDIEYLYNKYRSRAEEEIKEEKERQRKEKQDLLHRKIEELNKLKEEIENE